MDQLVYLIPIAILLGLVGLGAFLWSLRSGQFDDLDGAAHRILFDDDEEDHTGRPTKPGDRSASDSDEPGPHGGKRTEKQS